MFIEPNWPAPKHVKAYTSLRSGGMSQTPFDQFNLGDHVGDDPKIVAANREILKNSLQLPNDPIWIQQVHGINVVKAALENKECSADASYTNENHQVCAVLTADCLPILLCDRKGTHVAAIHAGWRGLLNGVIEATLSTMNLDNHEILAWLGPAIGPKHFEVGDEVRDAFFNRDSQAHIAFKPSPNQRWMADLYALARLRLLNNGVNAIYGGDYCTYTDANLFYSYRRDGGKTGRMATLIWINNPHTVRY
ncbi:MAG: peptidoglycan editing factor PgeF [Gammaproteobacteria bacterium]